MTAWSRAVAPGKAVISARTGTVDQKVSVQVIANTLASLELTPARSDAQTGDVIQFKVTARDRNGAVISRPHADVELLARQRA